MTDIDLSRRTVVLAGATSAAGLAVAARLLDAGAQVTATGRSTERLVALETLGCDVVVADATSLADMSALAERLGTVDGVIPLVGGWRGGGGLAGQSDDDLAALMPSFDAVRATSRAFDAALRASEAGRFAIVSAGAVARPLAGGANYAAVKAASETYTRAVAHGFAKAARDGDTPLTAAAVVLRSPASLDPHALAAAVVGLWDEDATDLNGAIRELG